MILNDETIKNFRQSKKFTEKNNINHIEYLYDGTTLALSTHNHLKTYDALTGTLQNSLKISNIHKFSFFLPNTVLLATDNLVKYLSTYNNSYIRHFKDHSAPIKDISTNLVNDTFLSSSKEKVNFWDIKVKNPVFSIKACECLTAFSAGPNFSILINNTLLKTYDTRNIRYGPVKTMVLPEFQDFKNITYSLNNEYLIASTSRTHYVICTDTYKIINTINFEKGSGSCVTPDSQYIIGCSGSSINVYGISNRKMICSFKDKEMEQKLVAFNPSYGQFVTASSSLVFWLPEVNVKT